MDERLPSTVLIDIMTDIEPPLRLGLIPGTQCDEALWSRLRKELKPSTATEHIAIEQSHGLTGMIAIIDKSCTRPRHLVGFSMGGYLALNYGLQQPEKVSSLVIIANDAGQLTQEEYILRKNMLAYLESHDYTGMSRARLGEFLRPDALGDAELVNTILEMDRRLGKSVLVNQLKVTSNRKSLLPRLSELNCPVLVIGGQDDKKCRHAT